MANDINPLAKWRAKKGLTTEVLAKKSGVAVSTISKIETGKSTPTLLTLGKLASALEIEIEELTELISPKDLPVVPTKYDIGRSPNIPDMAATMLGTSTL